jgi:hypothetical protein
MARVGRLEQAAILAAAIFVAACGSSATASPMPTSGAATAETTSTAIPTPAATMTQAASHQSLPPGVTVVDSANIILQLAWSPNGQLLAVLALGGELGSGRADILDVAGQRIASFAASGMAWVNDAHLMTLVASPNDAQRTATVRSIDGTESSPVPGTFGPLLGNGHGSVALAAPVVGSSYPADESFRIWSDGQLEQPISGYGHPVAWSSDGRLLALVGESPTAGPNGVGGPIPGTVTVLKLPEETVILSHQVADIRLGVAFSPDGSRLATGDGLILNLADGSAVQLTSRFGGWTSAGAMVIVGQDHRVSLRTPAGTTVVPDAFDWAVFGPNEGDIATLPAADNSLSAPVTAVVRRVGSALSIPLNVGFSVAGWSAGGVCYMTTGTVDAQLQDDRLLRIELPAA